MKILSSLLLLFAATLLALIILPIGFAYTLIGIIFFQSRKASRFESYMYYIALTIDQMGNVVAAYLFNDVLINKKAGHNFGNVDETISSVLGKNKRTASLRCIGKCLDKLLNKIEENHCEKSVEEILENSKEF